MTLFSYAKEDDVYNMGKLIQAGQDVNQCNENKETPLHIAAMFGSYNAAVLLVSSGANVKAKTNLFEESPLHFAVQEGNDELVSLLLDAGADINQENCESEGPIFTAIRWARPRMIKLLARLGAKLNDVNRLGQTPLQVATAFQSKSLVKALVENGATLKVSGVPEQEITKLTSDVPQADIENLNRPQTANPETCKKHGFRIADEQVQKLFEFASNNMVDKLKEMIENGADVNSKASFNGETIIHAATSYGATECVQALVAAGADVNAQTEIDLESPLHIAIREGYFDIFHCLLRAGANIELTNADGETPLFNAVKSNRTEMFRVLTRKGANVNHLSLGGISPMHFAVLAGNEFMLRSLLYYNADLTSGAINPYMFAFKAGDQKIASLIQQKAPFLSVETNLPKGIFEIIKQDDVESLDAMITKGFDLDLVDVLEGSPLHCAVRSHAMACLNLLLESGANPNVVDIQRKESPIMTAIGVNIQALERLFETKGVDAISIKNKEGETSLFYAVRRNDIELAKRLLQIGADANIKNGCGLTPLYISISLRYLEMAQLLLDNGADPSQEVHTSLSLASEMGFDEISSLLSDKGARMVPSRRARSDDRQSRLGKRQPNVSTEDLSLSTTLPARGYTPAGVRHGMCVICGRHPATQMLIPCNHIACCRGCIKTFVENHDPCPICGLDFYATKTTKVQQQANE